VTDLLHEPDVSAHRAGAEPLAGYRLLEPLGRGGFGEVWKCEAPGGLFKAVKFVPVGDDGFQQEMQAFERIKAIRHPFLLTLERVEVVGSDLVMVMELADCQLGDRFQECVAAGRAGIPRSELLGYMLEVAEALDMIGAKYGLQHLDVKPPNLFLVAGHAKVGDYGLVRRAERNGEKSAAGGFTPKYTSPEVLTGKVDIRSDQYSLALVYAELLTGRFPFPGTTANQLMMQHVTGTPDLSALPESDRAVVGRALSKDPAARFQSCLAFVGALIDSTTRIRTAAPALPPNQTTSASLDVTLVTGPRSDRGPRETVPSHPAQITTLSTASKSPSALLVRPQDRVETPVRVSDQVRRPPPTAPTESTDPFSDLTLVMSVERLHATRPRAVAADPMTVVDFVGEVVGQALARAPAAAGPQETGERIRFLSTVPPNLVPLKVRAVGERCGLTVTQPEPRRMVLRKEYKDPLARAGRPSYNRGGYEVVVLLPEPTAREVHATARVYGGPDQAFIRMAEGEMPEVLRQLRSELQNVQERRRHPRHRFDTVVRVYPLFTDGQIGKAVEGRLIDVSASGALFETPSEVGSGQMFIEFPKVEGVEGLAIYMRVVRVSSPTDSTGVITAGRFRRTD
jgi:serine/threonine protein kinase